MKISAEVNLKKLISYFVCFKGRLEEEKSCCDMEGALAEAEQQCRRYYDGYRTCIERFPETWHLDCIKEKDKFTKCAETHPLISSIKTHCAKEFKKYEECGLKNQDRLQHCGEEYKQFEICVSKVTAASKSEKTQKS